MKWLKRKIQIWLGIDKIEIQNNNLLKRIKFLAQVIKERTEYHLDVHRYKGSQVIIIGKYAKNDFVKIYSINDRSIKDLIDHCKTLEQHANLGRVDCWPDLSLVLRNEIL